MIPLSWYLMLSAVLFTIGVLGVLLRRNILIILMSIELILNSVNINLVAFSYYLQDLRGQIFAVFVITIAAAEVAVALGIVVSLVRNKVALNTEDIKTMKG
ncbi:MAG: NADH-quinone oxidoreductase subunit NuoK [Deltaproteobacteria bacterium]|nr:NADH-quinone oxidoreductase subunit NuoK [Deltaproteobacteria bacterium]